LQGPKLETLKTYLNMNQKYKLMKACIVLLSMMSMHMSGALSGAYTINSGLSTSGTNFQSFTDFATAINSQGVSGSVTVSVIGGPFNEQVTFTSWTGVSATNKVIINGNGCTLTWNASSSQPWTMGLNGTDYLTVNNLLIYGTNTTYAMVAHVWGGSDYDTFNNCQFICNANQSGSSQAPFSISSSANCVTCGGSNSGNYITVNSCTLQSGYYSYVSVGNYNAPYASHNTIQDSKISDFYYYGPYAYYNDYFTMKNCTIDRITSTGNGGYMYPAYVYFNNYAMIDGNKWYKLFELTPSTSCSMYFYVMYQHNAGAGRQTFRNNIITDIKTNGYIYTYLYYGAYDIYHNTFDWDNPTGNFTSSLYGMYVYGGSSYGPTNVYNNIITLRRPGSGNKYGIYAPGSSGVNIDYNDIVVGTGTGGNYLGYGPSGSASTLSSWQGMGFDTHGWSTDPQYTSATDLHPTNTAINNSGTPLGVYLDQQKAPRSGTTPDIGALEFLSVPCSGTPTPGSVLSPTYQLCPGESADIMLSNFSSDLGITYQWQSSTQSSVGIWTPIQGANTPFYTTPGITVPTWYQVVVTCTNSSNGVSPVGYVQVAGTTTSVVPYFENFESIPFNNKLPNCSWMATNLGSNALTYTTSNQGNLVPRSGSRFASFYYSPAGANSFYTNAIQLNAGVTYSASVWYTTEYYGYNNWTDLSILVGPNQSATGQQTIASTGGPAISNIYKSLSNTFTVATSGLYYVAIRATSNANSYAYNLSWDDLRIEAPCSMNTPPMTVTSNQGTVCAGQNITLQASGADTYSWSTGDQTDIVTTAPIFAGMQTYYVTGTSTLSGCSITLAQNILGNPAPQINVFANPPSVCEGSSVNLHAFGASNFIWSTNGTGNVISVTPANPGTSVYNVVGTNQYNCTSSASVAVVVNAKPNIGATAPATACVGETHQIVASGGTSYQFVSQNSYNTVNPAYISPSTSTQYTVYGTDANGCTNFTMVTVVVDACTGIRENGALAGLKVYPNPSNGQLNVELNNSADKTVQIVDVTGRIVLAGQSAEATLKFNLSTLANGVYYVKVKSQDDIQVIKIIKE
jgi:hypothetical protein